MKFVKIFATALAVVGAGTFVSCSSDAPDGGPNNPNETEASRYVRVSIATISDTRAETDADFETGTAGESKISNLAFYFFDENDNPYKMENNTVTGDFFASNMVRPTNDVISGDGVVSTTLVLGKKADTGNEGWKGQTPKKMIAVANLMTDDAYQELANRTIADMKKKTRAAKSTFTSGEFIMSSSTYSKGGNLISWSNIETENVCTTPEEALKAPVIVYLERLAVKYSVELGGEGSNAIKMVIDGTERTVFPVEEKLTSSTNDGVTTIAKKKYYAYIPNWDLNGTAAASSIIKDVKTEEIPTGYASAWNDVSRFRSYWASTPSAKAIKTAFSWNGLIKRPGNPMDENQSLRGSAGYSYENTLQPYVDRSQDASTQATKILLKAIIVDENGNRCNMVSWAGLLYDFEDFQEIVAKHSGHTEADKALVSIVHNVAGDGENAQPRYVSYATYDGEPVANFDNLRYWDNGECYYILNVRHTTVKENNKDVDIYGVVRNHWYKFTIKTIKGLGTPGGDDPHGYPENPDPEEESYVAAKVQILPWHIVINNSNVGS